MVVLVIIIAIVAPTDAARCGHRHDVENNVARIAIILAGGMTAPRRRKQRKALYTDRTLGGGLPLFMIGRGRGCSSVVISYHCLMFYESADTFRPNEADPVE